MSMGNLLVYLTQDALYFVETATKILKKSKIHINNLLASVTIPPWFSNSDNDKLSGTDKKCWYT